MGRQGQSGRAHLSRHHYTAGPALVLDHHRAIATAADRTRLRGNARGRAGSVKSSVAQPIRGIDRTGRKEPAVRGRPVSRQPNLCWRAFMNAEDAAAFIVDCIAKPRPSAGYSTYGYEVYVPNFIAAYLSEVERPPGHESTWREGPRARELAPIFNEAAWDLCRRGILRPGVQKLGGQGDGGTGNGYTVTAMGRAWLAKGTLTPILFDQSRLGQLFETLSKPLGRGFQQRATEAATCHALGCYLASCAMCGAAAESILLSVAIAKIGDEATVLKTYLSSQGRKRTINSIIHGAVPALADPFKAATSLLSYWRDEAAHGAVSEISEIEAHTALGRLVRFAQFTCDNWAELTARTPSD